MNSRTSGAIRIFLYNWPIYAVTWGGALVAMIAAARIGSALGWFVGLGASTAAIWSALSLLVSHYVYDRSALARASWASALAPARTTTWASIDAGLDAEVALDDVLPGTCIARLDIYDGVVVGAGSLRRARATTPRKHVATRSRASALTLADASCDLITVVFSAHELRDAAERERFFRELKRSLRPSGRVLLVEHLRDLPNFVAFGPGFTHFQPRAEWLRLAEVTGLRAAVETRITPWVMALALEKTS